MSHAIRKLETQGSQWCNSKSKSLRTRGANGIHPSPRAGEDKIPCPSSICEAEKNERIPPSFSFSSIQSLSSLHDA